MLQGRGFSMRIAVDLIAGAIDVWLHPGVTMAAASAANSANEEEKTMLSRVLSVDCARTTDPGISRADAWKAAATMILVTLVLTLAWVALVARFPRNDVVNALSSLPFFIGLLASMRYTYLKERSAVVLAIFIAMFTIVIAAILGAAGLIASAI
jgi:hypothetical protein